jgi:hypothetical protein
VISRSPARVVAVELPGGEHDVDTEANWSALVAADLRAGR